MRKLKRPLQRINIDELFDNSSNRGMLSFLERPPEEAQARLREKQRVNEVDSQRLLPVGELPPGWDSSQEVPEKYKERLREKQDFGARKDIPTVPFSAAAPARLAGKGSIQEDGKAALAVSYPQGTSPLDGIHLLGNEPEEVNNTDQNRQPKVGLSIKAGVFNPQGKLPSGRLHSPTERPIAKPTSPSHPEGKLPTVTELTLIDGAIVGRRQKIRRANVAQDGHSSGEQLLYQSLWNAARPETPETRLLSIGYNGMSALCKLDRSNCKNNIQSLIGKLSVQVAESYDSASSTGTTYRIFSYREILRRREAAGMVWVVRTSGVRFVNPMGNLPPPPGGDLTRDPVCETPTDPRGETRTPPICETPTPLGRQRTLEGLSSSALLRAALSRYGTVDEDALVRLIRNCREQAADCTEEELIYFIHEKGLLARARNTRIQNPIGFLIEAVPKCFSGEAFRLYRYAKSNMQATQDTNQQDHDRQWGREHEADLSDPTVPEEVKEVIRRCLGKSCDQI